MDNLCRFFRAEKASFSQKYNVYGARIHRIAWSVRVCVCDSLATCRWQCSSTSSKLLKHPTQVHCRCGVCFTMKWMFCHIGWNRQFFHKDQFYRITSIIINMRTFRSSDCYRLPSRVLLLIAARNFSSTLFFPFSFVLIHAKTEHNFHINFQN